LPTPQNFKNCNELTQLPYFEMNPAGKPVLAVDDAPPIVDFHTHLGSYYFLSRPIDLFQHTETVDHCFRHDELPIDLSLYSGVNLRNTRRNGTFSDHAHTILTNKGSNATYTIPNLIEEMDRMGVEKSIVLAIDMPGGSQNSLHQAKYLQGNPRLIPFCAVNVQSRRWEEDMDRCVAMGARGLKVHPYAQFLPPNHSRMMKLYKRWSKTGLPVLFHTANNGLEPSFLRKLSDMELYEEPLKKFPEIPFIMGHAGMLFYELAVKYAKAHGNTYLEIGGQPPQNIRHMIEILGNDKILFGTDWPFYPLILPLAKVLVATETDRESRDLILSGNAFRLIEQYNLCGNMPMGQAV